MALIGTLIACKQWPSTFRERMSSVPRDSFCQCFGLAASQTFASGCGGWGRHWVTIALHIADHGLDCQVDEVDRAVGTWSMRQKERGGTCQEVKEVSATEENSPFSFNPELICQLF